MEKSLKEKIDIMKNNDDKILDLKKQIGEKKNLLKKIKKFAPITNCILDLDGVKTNIQVLNKQQLVLLASKLHSYDNSAKELGLSLEIGGFLATEWIEDIKLKLDTLNVKEEERKLKLMEDKLTNLLSNDKRVELEINEIEELLK